MSFTVSQFRDEVDSMDQEGALFKGPRNYAVTAAKYMNPFKDIVGKRQRAREDLQRAGLPQKVRSALSVYSVLCKADVSNFICNQLRS